MDRVASAVSLLIREASLVVAEPGIYLEDVDVLVEDGRIAEIGRGLCGEGADIIEARGLVLTPGLASAHTHLALYPVRTMFWGLRLDDWVSMVLAPWESSLGPRDSFEAALLGSSALLAGGATFVADMHFNMDAVARAVEFTGIRADLSVAIMDKGVRRDFDALLRENIELHTRWRAHPRITVSFGPCTVRLLGAENLRRVFQEARRRNAGIHMHLSEVPEDAAHTMRVSGLRPAQYVDSVGGLAHDVVFAHGVHLSLEEIILLARRGVSVIHNPSANLLLGSGLAPCREMLDLGVNVGLGVDVSPSYSVVDEMRQALGVSAARGRQVSPEEIYWAATRGGYAAFRLRGGAVRRGFLADLVLWRPLSLGGLSPETAVVIGGLRPEIVIVGGTPVLRGGRLLGVPRSILEEAEERVAVRVADLYGDAGHRFYSEAA